ELALLVRGGEAAVAVGSRGREIGMGDEIVPVPAPDHDGGIRDRLAVEIEDAAMDVDGIAVLGGRLRRRGWRRRLEPRPERERRRDEKRDRGGAAAAESRLR